MICVARRGSCVTLCVVRVSWRAHVDPQNPVRLWVGLGPYFFPCAQAIFDHRTCRPWQGPAFVPSGIHKPAYFITLSDPSNPKASVTDAPQTSSSSSPILISESSIDIFKQGYVAATGDLPDETAPWVVNVSLAVHSAVDAPSPSLTLSIAELGLTSHPIALPPIRASSAGSHSVMSVPTWLSTADWTIHDSAPDRWYPHNLGTPKLYNLTLTLDLHLSESRPFDNSTSHSGAGSITLTTPVGFRTIRLAQTRYPDAEVAARGITPGDQWHFEVNGKAFYALGTNIIPFDPFYARITDAQVAWVLESAVRSGQNMVRRGSGCGRIWVRR